MCNTPPSCARERIDEREREKMIWTQRAARFISKCAIKLPTIVGLVARLFVASHKTKKKREREKKKKRNRQESRSEQSVFTNLKIRPATRKERFCRVWSMEISSPERKNNCTIGFVPVDFGFVRFALIHSSSFCCNLLRFVFSEIL